MTFYIGRTRVEISFWFLAGVTAFVLLDRSFIALSLLSTILLHEGAHLVPMLLYGVKIRCARLCLYGVQLSCDLSALPARRRAAVYLCAPALNLLTGGLLYLLRPIEIFGAFNVCVGLFNLIPIPPLDGGNAAAALFTSRRADSIRRLIGVLFVLPLLGGAVYLCFNAHNFTLLICTLYLLFCAVIKI